MLSALQMPSARKLLRARRSCDPCSKHKESAQLRASAPPCDDARDGARKNQCTVPTSPPCDDARTMPMLSHASETPRTTKLGHHHRDLKGAHRTTTTMLSQAGACTEHHWQVSYDPQGTGSPSARIGTKALPRSSSRIARAVDARVF